MASLHAGRLIGWAVGCALAPIALGMMLGPAWIVVGVGIAVAFTLCVLIWLPRSAHAAFEAAQFERANRWYRVIGALAFTAGRERAATLSRAGCELGAGRPGHADRVLDAIDPAVFGVSERVVWLNNRVCAALDAGRDPHGALAQIDEAIALRPDVPAVQHTRARALLAVSRVDDAIAVLEAMRAAGELSPRLEAERCRALAEAWEHKGHAEYANDYRNRARLIAR